MKTHQWTVIEVDGGHLGVGGFYECTVCCATNWTCPDMGRPPGKECFLACGCGPDVTALSEDCEVATEWVVNHLLTCKFKDQFLRGGSSDRLEYDEIIPG